MLLICEATQLGIYLAQSPGGLHRDVEMWKLSGLSTANGIFIGDNHSKKKKKERWCVDSNIVASLTSATYILTYQLEYKLGTTQNIIIYYSVFISSIN